MFGLYNIKNSSCGWHVTSWSTDRHVWLFTVTQHYPYNRFSSLLVNFRILKNFCFEDKILFARKITHSFTWFLIWPWLLKLLTGFHCTLSTVLQWHPIIWQVFAVDYLWHLRLSWCCCGRLQGTFFECVMAECSYQSSPKHLTKEHVDEWIQTYISGR